MSTTSSARPAWPKRSVCPSKPSKPAWRASIEARQAGFDGFEGQTERFGHAGRAEDVVDIRAADKRRPHGDVAARRLDAERQAFERRVNVDRPDVGVLIDGVRQDV